MNSYVVLHASFIRVFRPPVGAILLRLGPFFFLAPHCALRRTVQARKKKGVNSKWTVFLGCSTRAETSTPESNFDAYSNTRVISGVVIGPLIY
jgi:hypothetical protein